MYTKLFVERTKHFLFRPPLLDYLCVDNYKHSHRAAGVAAGVGHKEAQKVNPDGSMSFDLYFCRKNNSIPAIPELKEYFLALPHFNVSDVDASGVQFWYENEITGVYCDFSYSPLDAKEVEGCGSSGLTFNLNYLRPSFFAYETMPLVEAFCKRFDLVVEDSQEETVEPADAERLIVSWRSHNARAVRVMIQTADEHEIEMHYLPEHRATEWWRYTSVQQRIEDAVTEDIFVPSVMVLRGPTKKLFTLLLWPNGIAQFFPPCDYVYVQREKKRLFKTKDERGLVPYRSVLETIEPLLDEYEFHDLHIKYLSPDKAAEAEPLVQTLNLEPIDLSQYGQVPSDKFHDVEVSE